jgi:hypothetical protein
MRKTDTFEQCNFIVGITQLYNKTINFQLPVLLIAFSLVIVDAYTLRTSH